MIMDFICFIASEHYVYGVPYMWPDLQKPDMSQEHASDAMCVFMTLDRKLSTSSFCDIHVKEPFY